MKGSHELVLHCEVKMKTKLQRNCGMMSSHFLFPTEVAATKIAPNNQYLLK